ncbi:cytochrome P450 [Cladorrhinum sp. PSN259]|nr:cytochrome P450 [Cladorrhinum sp. PSN259]
MIMMAWFSASSLATAFVLVLTVLAVSLRIFRKQQNDDLKDIVTVGINLASNENNIISWTLAILRSLTSTSEWAHDGYRRFSKAPIQRAFALPSMWTGSVMVVLPPSLLESVLNRPEAELAAHRAQLDSIQLPYMLSDPDVYDNPIQFDVVRRNMSRQNVRSLAGLTAAALHDAFTACWVGPDKKDNNSWTTLNNWDACGKIFTRVTMLSLVGPTLSRDEQLLDWVRKFASSVITGTAFVNSLPPGWIRSSLGPLFGIQAKFYQYRCLKIMVPVIQERMRKRQDGARRHVDDDFIESTISRCARTGDPTQMDPQRIALRLLGLASMSIMGMVYVFTHCIADVYGSPRNKRDEFLAALEAECNQQAQTDDNAKSFHLESTLNESMRLNNISVTSLARDVVVDSLHIPISDKPSAGHGYRLPRGTRVVFPTQDMHRDESVFGPKADEFDALRFSRESRGEGGRTDDMRKNLLFFGYGKHGCPGRHYAMEILKQALSYVVLNYDVQLVETAADDDGAGFKKETKKTLLNVNVPNVDQKIRVRRKM